MSESVESNAVDLTNCDREPIHIPGRIQPHGVMLVMQEPALTVVQVSANAASRLGLAADEVLGRPLDAVLDATTVDALRRFLERDDLDMNPSYALPVRVRDGAVFEATAHRSGGLVVLELEEPSEHMGGADFYALIRTAMARLQGAASLHALCDVAATEMRRITGFDRVMIYRFAEDDTGTVIAEARRDDMPPYLGLRYPASDIPKQARALYLLNWLRLTADAHATPVPLEPVVNPVTGRPLDMSFAVLRAMSPVHIEYLKNMGVTASMSVSIVRDGRLWGLISCHHDTPKYVPYDVRAASEFLGRVVSVQLAAKEELEENADRVRLKAAHARLVEALATSAGVHEALARPDADLPGFLSAGGAAVVVGDAVTLLGETPPEAAVRDLAAWLESLEPFEVFATDALSERYAPAAAFADAASGVAAIPLSSPPRDFVLWFRPEVIRTVTWGGDPNKPASPGDDGVRLSPRKSFEAWRETVRLRAVPWSAAEVDAARDLRRSVVEVALRRVEELTALNEELTRSNEELRQFAYVASHDLQEPLRMVSSYTQLLARRYSGQIDEKADQYIAFAVEGATRMQRLIQDLLEFSRAGNRDRPLETVDSGGALRQAMASLRLQIDDTRAVVTRDEVLPVVQADPAQLAQVFQNLLSNALKFRDPERVPRVHVGAAWNGSMWRFSVSDNGIGIDPQYFDRIFVIFQRLHTRAKHPGSGIGLALCKKIVELHGGRLWLESTAGEGTTFHFTLRAADGGAPSGRAQ